MTSRDMQKRFWIRSFKEWEFFRTNSISLDQKEWNVVDISQQNGWCRSIADRLFNACTHPLYGRVLSIYYKLCYCLVIDVDSARCFNLKMSSTGTQIGLSWRRALNCFLDGNSVPHRWVPIHHRSFWVRLKLWGELSSRKREWETLWRAPLRAALLWPPWYPLRF